jgi:GMC oxidoreductase
VRRSTLVLVVALLLAVLSGGVARAGGPAPGPVQPYVAPPFAGQCSVHRFGEGVAPDPTAYPDDPLCVEYAKRDITVDNGGAIRFLLAEPTRFAIAVPKCQYWQQDHWSVQFSRGDVPVVRWDGSYWFEPTLLALTEDDNEGVFGPPPPTGDFVRAAPTAVLRTLSYHANAHTMRGWTSSDRAIASIIEKDGIGEHLSWVGGQPTLTAHPLSSCRMGDDPATSALTSDHELRGFPGLFVTDGSAVPTSLTVNPSLTIAALAERASVAIGRRAREAGIPLRSGVPAPGSA